MTRREWVKANLGNPDEWYVDNQGVIHDSVRPRGQQVVGEIVSRAHGVATILWWVSKTMSDVPDWTD